MTKMVVKIEKNRTELYNSSLYKKIYPELFTLGLKSVIKVLAIFASGGYG